MCLPPGSKVGVNFTPWKLRSDQVGGGGETEGQETCQARQERLPCGEQDTPGRVVWSLTSRHREQS